MKPVTLRRVIRNIASQRIGLVCRFLVLVFLAVAVTVPNVWGQSSRHFLFCFSDHKQHVIYFSDIFEKDGEIPHTVSGIISFSAPVEAAFRQFVKQKYSYDAPADCGFASETPAQAQEQKQRSEAAEKQANHQIVETGWKFTPGQAVAQTPPSPAPASSASAPQSGDPRLAHLSPQDRKFVLDEIAGSKSYCATNMVLPLIFDCGCFAQMVFDYRVSRPIVRSQPTTSDLAAGRPAQLEPISNIMTKLNCSKCISEERITKWVTDTVRKNFSGYNPGREPEVKAISECASRKLIADLRAKPELGDIDRGRYNVAVQACSK